MFPAVLILEKDVGLTGQPVGKSQMQAVIEIESMGWGMAGGRAWGGAWVCIDRTKMLNGRCSKRFNFHHLLDFYLVSTHFDGNEKKNPILYGSYRLYSIRR